MFGLRAVLGVGQRIPYRCKGFQKGGYIDGNATFDRADSVVAAITMTAAHTT